MQKHGAPTSCKAAGYRVTTWKPYFFTGFGTWARHSRRGIPVARLSVSFLTIRERLARAPLLSCEPTCSTRARILFLLWFAFACAPTASACEWPAHEYGS